jgi:1-acyl-sn-glycerol-3-phosphate acyltransferase
MADEMQLAESARGNGAGGGPGAEAPGAFTISGPGVLGSLAALGTEAVKTGATLAGRAAGPVVERLQDTLSADFDDRDPDYIRDNLPLVWLLSSLWFRGEVRNLGNVPEDRSVLLVGNHSGGNMTPDTILFTLAFSTYFGVERPFHQLAHNLVLAHPLGQILKKYGTVTASHEHARAALENGAALLVYPGGDWEVHRSIAERNKVDFGGRKGFIRLALDAGVPIVPVVSIGGQETSLFLSRGDWLARLLGLDRLLRLKVLPVSLALPWGINVGDFLGHIPLPAKITTEVLPPIDIRAEFGEDPDLDEVYDHVTRVMQETLDSLAEERRYPIIG